VKSFKGHIGEKYTTFKIVDDFKYFGQNHIFELHKKAEMSLTKIVRSIYQAEFFGDYEKKNGFCTGEIFL